MDDQSRNPDCANPLCPVSQGIAGRASQILQPSVQHQPCSADAPEAPGMRGSGGAAGGLQGLTCGWCGNALTNCTIRREYCDGACRRRAYAAEKLAQTVANRKCLWCSGPIPVERRPGTIYCSRTCGFRSGADMRRKRNKRACKSCGTAFFGHHHQAYCCHACYCDAKRKRRPKACPVCQKMFKPHRPSQTCCSNDCATPGRRRLPDISCAACGELFRPKRSSTRFCSRSCAMRGRGRGGQ